MVFLFFGLNKSANNLQGGGEVFPLNAVISWDGDYVPMDGNRAGVHPSYVLAGILELLAPSRMAGNLAVDSDKLANRWPLM